MPAATIFKPNPPFPSTTCHKAILPFILPLFFLHRETTIVQLGISLIASLFLLSRRRGSYKFKERIFKTSKFEKLLSNYPSLHTPESHRAVSSMLLEKHALAFLSEAHWQDEGSLKATASTREKTFRYHNCHQH